MNAAERHFANQARSRMKSILGIEGDSRLTDTELAERIQEKVDRLERDRDEAVAAISRLVEQGIGAARCPFCDPPYWQRHADSCHYAAAEAFVSSLDDEEQHDG